MNFQEMWDNIIKNVNIPNVGHQFYLTQWKEIFNLILFKHSHLRVVAGEVALLKRGRQSTMVIVAGKVFAPPLYCSYVQTLTFRENTNFCSGHHFSGVSS